jgi:hypothetical protein
VLTARRHSRAQLSSDQAPDAFALLVWSYQYIDELGGCRLASQRAVSNDFTSDLRYNTVELWTHDHVTGGSQTTFADSNTERHFAPGCVDHNEHRSERLHVGTALSSKR